MFVLDLFIKDISKVRNSNVLNFNVEQAASEENN